MPRYETDYDDIRDLYYGETKATFDARSKDGWRLVAALRLDLNGLESGKFVRYLWSREVPNVS